jgi:hypothetical protein
LTPSLRKGSQPAATRGHFLDDADSKQPGSFALVPQITAATRIPDVENQS